MLSNILPKYPDIRGKWAVEYSKDIILSGHIGDHRLFVVYWGNPALELRSKVAGVRNIRPFASEREHVIGIVYFDRQFSSIAWGVFYWPLAGSNVKHIYDVRCNFLDETLAKIELIPPKRLSTFHINFLLVTKNYAKNHKAETILFVIILSV